MTAASGALWTDYVAAFGAILGVLIAATALVMARLSARDAERSADSSERTARAAEATSRAGTATLEAATEQLRFVRMEHDRVEADRARRPAVERVEFTEVHPHAGEEAPPGIFRVGFKNTGDRELRDAFLTILVDPGCRLLMTDRVGNLQRDRSRDETRERWPGVSGAQRAFDFFTLRLDVPVGVSIVQYACATRFGGQFPIRARLFSASLDGGGPWVDAWVDIGEDGTARITRLSPEAGMFDGRCADFDSLPRPE